MDVAVLGAGSLGRGVAQVCVLAGHRVSLQDEDANVVMDGVDGVERGLTDLLEAGEIDRETHTEVTSLVDATTGLEAAVADADVIVETAGGDLEPVRALFAEVEELADREALIATGATDSRLTAVAAGLRHPDRALGLHFRDPVDSPLVEVVAAEQTAEETTDRALEFVESLDRRPILLGDAPGRLADRQALVQEVEAMRLVEAGVAAVPAIDDALILGYDYPAGPLERADREGLADRLETLESLAATLGPRFDPPPVLRELVADGKTGAAAGEGFYVWEDDRPAGPAVEPPEIAGRQRGPDDPGR